MVFKKMLEGHAVSIHVASNGLEALEQVQQFNPDFVYMDMRMPEMDGIEATRAVRALGGSYATLPIVALTANAFPDDIKLCREAGMNDFIAKPVRKKLLVSKVAELVAGMSAQPEPASNAPARVSEADTIAMETPARDCSVLSELADEIGEDGVEATLSIFLNDTDKRVGLLQSMTQKLDRGGIKAEAHALKGSSAIFGFQRMSALAAHLERNAATLSGEDCNRATDLIVEALGAIRREFADTVNPPDAKRPAA
jgi:CheY-like chemotaxis protein